MRKSVKTSRIYKTSKVTGSVTDAAVAWTRKKAGIKVDGYEHGVDAVPRTANPNVFVVVGVTEFEDIETGTRVIFNADRSEFRFVYSVPKPAQTSGYRTDEGTWTETRFNAETGDWENIEFPS